MDGDSDGEKDMLRVDDSDGEKVGVQDALAEIGMEKLEQPEA